MTSKWMMKKRPTGEPGQAQEQDQPQDQDTQQSQPSERVPPVSISYDKYVSIMNMLVKKITEDEKMEVMDFRLIL